MHLNILISNKRTRFKYTFKYLVNQYRTCDEGLIAYFRIRFGLCKIVNKLKFDQTKWVEEKLFNCIYMAEKMELNLINVNLLLGVLSLKII